MVFLSSRMTENFPMPFSHELRSWLFIKTIYRMRPLREGVTMPAVTIGMFRIHWGVTMTVWPIVRPCQHRCSLVSVTFLIIVVTHFLIFCHRNKDFKKSQIFSKIIQFWWSSSRQFDNILVPLMTASQRWLKIHTFTHLAPPQLRRLRPQQYFLFSPRRGWTLVAWSQQVCFRGDRSNWFKRIAIVLYRVFCHRRVSIIKQELLCRNKCQMSTLITLIGWEESARPFLKRPFLHEFFFS